MLLLACDIISALITDAASHSPFLKSIGKCVRNWLSSVSPDYAHYVLVWSK